MAVRQKNPELGRREAKKEKIRRAIVQSAHALCEKRGFDSVTVAEIAKAAKTSVKTLFTYFDTKEDIVFEGEFDLLEGLQASLAARKKGVSLVKAFHSAVIERVNEERKGSTLAQIEGFERMTGNAVIQSRLQMMWWSYENKLTDFIASEVGAKEDDPKPRLAAIQLVAVLRTSTSQELKNHLKEKSNKEQRESFAEWLKQSFKFISKNLEDYGTK